ncbi:MAG: succinate dehydrogenase cytochrome b subunit [Bacteroidales bacterium]|nr:succinate dehydrogenase cytochrome b subunit [Bacteroidales bacterium]
MWLVHSSIGRKVVMSISGLFLIVFLCVHLTANAFMYVSPQAFGKACEFMGSPLVMAVVPVLALGFIFHIIYAFVLNARNLKARGHEKYAGGNNTGVSFAARNMLVLGIIVLGGLAFHLTQFWAQMQLQVFMGSEEYPLLVNNGMDLFNAEGELIAPYLLARIYFGNVIFSVCYIVWIAALWFHLSHGFWSAFQTLGVNNKIWFKRWNVIGIIFATVICLGFVSFPISFLLGILC